MQNHRLLRGVLRVLCAFADYLLLMLPVQLVLLFWIRTTHCRRIFCSGCCLPFMVC